MTDKPTARASRCADVLSVIRLRGTLPARVKPARGHAAKSGNRATPLRTIAPHHAPSWLAGVVAPRHAELS